MKEYKYDSITVNTKTGNKYTYDYCDYFIQDGILTVFRNTTFKVENYIEKKTHLKFNANFLMDNIECICCIEG